MSCGRGGGESRRTLVGAMLTLDHDLLPSGGSFARAPRMARLMCRLLAVLLLAHVLYGTAPMTPPDDSAPLTPSISRAGRSERLVHGTPRRRCGQS